jgi:hypothetical protein
MDKTSENTKTPSFQNLMNKKLETGRVLCEVGTKRLYIL